ncbi:MAG: hypothetical protein ACK5C0_06465 [Candidatus Kapaibacterium sp.]|jgi:hypothetical protein
MVIIILCCCDKIAKNQKVTYNDKEKSIKHSYQDNTNNDNICMPHDLEFISQNPQKYLQQNDSCISRTIEYIEQEYYKGKNIQAMECFDSLCKNSDGAVSELLGNRLFEIYISKPCVFVTCFDTNFKYCRRSFAYELMIQEFDHKSVEAFLKSRCDDKKKINNFTRKIKRELSNLRDEN